MRFLFELIDAPRAPLRRALLSLAALLLTGAESTRAAQLEQSVPTLWIWNIHVVDTQTGTIANDRAVGISDGRIVAIKPASEMPAGDNAQRVDGGGAFAIPGLWDAHVHLLQAGDAAARQQASAMLGHGITHVRDMGSSLAARAAFLIFAQSPAAAVPTMLSAGPAVWAFESPWGNPSQRLVAGTDAAIDAAVARLADAKVDLVKVYAGFDSARLRILVAAAKRRGLPVAGHAQTGMTLAEQARMGVQTIEHFDFSTFAECVPEAEVYFGRVISARFRKSGESIPGIYDAFSKAADTPECRQGLRAAAAAGLVLTPTLISSFLSSGRTEPAMLSGSTAQREECALYRAQFEGSEAQDGERLAAAGRRLMQIVLDAGVPLLAGTDSPSFCARPGQSLATELALMFEAGMSPLAVLQAATLLPAQRLGGGAAVGRIAIDSPANFLLLEGNPLLNVGAYERPLGLYSQGQWRDAGALARLRNGQNK